MKNPYIKKSDKAFWKRSVAGRTAEEISDLFAPLPNLSTLKIATAGSCFAQHIGRNLQKRNMNFLDYEKAPGFLADEDANALGYGVYSCRYGNIYTVRQLWQLFQEAFGMRSPAHPVWMKGERYCDALRPGVQPDGFGSVEELETLRAAHLKRVKDLFCDLDVFVFTLGLTEAWVDKRDGTVYPIAPGVMAGTYDPEIFGFANYKYPEILQDMNLFINALRVVNPNAQIILTISPVSLAATASDDHVLVATTYSKSTLRAVAGDLALEDPRIHYFPSYEIITGQPAAHKYYEEDLRSVRPEGVADVMGHFFGEKDPDFVPVIAASTEPTVEKNSMVGFEHCEESLIEEAAK